MPRYSVVIPVYNRPEELDELLTSLTHQSFRDFEVIVVEDGSTITSEDVVGQYRDRLNIHYFTKKNEGQGFARNYGFTRAQGDIITIFDSDCLIPDRYFEIVESVMGEGNYDVYGGPDAALPSFTAIQKAIDHTMTSFLTTGGIRGKKVRVGHYHPRSFNMGVRKEVVEKTGGYLIPFMGEDLEWSVRMIKSGFSTVLIPEAFVYHKRRTSLNQFFKQLFYFGRARVNLSRFHPGEIKWVHLFPSFFLLGLFLSLILSGVGLMIGGYLLLLIVSYLISVMIEGWIRTRSFAAGLLTPVTAMLQLCGYGSGLIYESVRKWMGKNPNTRYTELY